MSATPGKASSLPAGEGKLGPLRWADAHRVAKCSFLLPSSDVHGYLKMSKNAWFWCRAANEVSELAKTNGGETILKHHGCCLAPVSPTKQPWEAPAGQDRLWWVISHEIYLLLNKGIRFLPRFEAKLKLDFFLHGIVALHWSRLALLGCAHSL